MKRRVNCPECSELAPDPRPNAARPPRVFDVDRVRAEQAQDTTPHRHQVDVGHVRMQYTVRQLIACSFPGAHAHLSGLVAEVRCGAIYRLGHDCAHSYVDGVEALYAHLTQQNEEAGWINQIEEAAYMRDRYEKLQTRTQRVNAGLLAQGHLLDDLSAAAHAISELEQVHKGSLSQLARVDKSFFARKANKAHEHMVSAERALAASEMLQFRESEKAKYDAVAAKIDPRINQFFRDETRKKRR